MTFRGYRSWVLRDPEYLALERDCDSMVIGTDGQLHHASYVDGKGSEQTKEVGEPLVVPAWAIDAAEEVTKLALRLWDQAYHELAADLKVPDLAAEVVAAAASDPTLGWGGPAPVTNGSGASEPVAEPAEGDAASWRLVDGWYPDGSSAEGRRATLLASVLPEVCAVVNLNGSELLSARSKGVHVAVLGTTDATGAGQPTKVRNFAGVESIEAIAEWAKAVPEGTLVLMAIVDLADAGLVAAYKALTKCLGPERLAPLPRGCRVAVAAGRKGEAQWTDTHAAAEVASLVLHVP